MDFSNAFTESRPLGFFLGERGAFPDQWLYIPREISKIDLSTPCYILAIDPHELSPEEQDELDEYLKSVGLSCFLTFTDLEQVAENLRQQRRNASDLDFLGAIDYYWRHDAFICLTA